MHLDFTCYFEDVSPLIQIALGTKEALWIIAALVIGRSGLLPSGPWVSSKWYKL